MGHYVCDNKATHYIDSTYGRQYICGDCLIKHPLPEDMRLTKLDNYRRTTLNLNCECEHISHFQDKEN